MNVDVNDFAINAKVRQVLARRWVRVGSLEIGVTEGVVLVKGHLDTEPGGWTDLEEGENRQRFIKQLRADLATIPGVVDIVIDSHSGEGDRRQWTGTGN